MTPKDTSDPNENIEVGSRGVYIGGNATNNTIITGDGNVVGSDLRPVFEPVYRAIAQSDRPKQDKEDLKAEVQEVEQAVKQPEVDEPWLARRLRNLQRMAPDIAGVLLAGLKGPQAVVSEAVKKIAAKAQEESGAPS
ncbi:MAG: hypothetical protein Fur0018_18560 [Anaerolineales bacterium]